MKRPQITPGDWQEETAAIDLSGDSRACRTVKAGNGWTLAICTGWTNDRPSSQAEANARTIAALPKLLDALEHAHRVALAMVHDANPFGDVDPRDSMELAGAIQFEQSIRRALAAAGYEANQPVTVS